MNILKYIFFFTLTILFQNSILAQEWISYKSQQKINDLVDTGNELLMATDAGLVVMNKTTLEKTIFNKANSNLVNNHIPTITQTSNGDIWIGTYDIVFMRFDGTDFQDMIIPQHPDYNPQSSLLYDLKIAPNGDFWAGTSDGVFRKQNQNWLHYDETQIEPAFSKAWDIEINDAGEVFVASNGLYKFANEQWSNISTGTQLEGYISGDFFFSSTGDMYFAGDLDQIGRFDGLQWEEYDVSLNGSEILKFTEDLNGDMYFNTKYDGVFKLINNVWTQQTDAQTQAFDDKVSYFHIDDQNNRWMNNNIYLTVDKNGSIESTTISDYTLESNQITDVHKGENGNMYFIFQSSNEIAVLDTNGDWSLLSSPTPNASFEYFNNILFIADNDIFVSSNQGFYHYDGTDWTFTASPNCKNIIADAQGKVYIRAAEKIFIIENGVTTEYNVNNSPLSTFIISGLGVDANDNLWIASFTWDDDNAIQKVSTAGTWTTYMGDDYPVIDRPSGAFHFDSDGNPWIALGTARAIKFDGTTWTNPFADNGVGISNIEVHSISSDATGKLYFAHQYGVTTLLDGQWGNLLIPDDEVPNDASSNESTIDFDDDGTLWWGNTRNGVFSFSPALVLPVELLSFDVKATPKNQVKIDWSTASETQNDFFIIERSKDGSTWEMVEKVAKKGNSEGISQYSKLDKSPYEGTSFYRLKQIDYNGNEMILPIKAITIKGITKAEIALYPNPTSDFLHIDLNENVLQTLSLFNHLGQDVTATINRTSTNQKSVTLHLNQLTSGHYYLVMNGELIQQVVKK